MVEAIPNLSEIPEFYSKLCHLLVDNDELKLAVAKINGIITVIIKLSKDTVRTISRAKNARECADIRKAYYGRISSIINKQNGTLEYLTEAVKKLQTVPDLNLTLPCVVCAGAPNVGKSSITAKISSFEPEISEYPFTTKGILIEIIKTKRISCFSKSLIRQEFWTDRWKIGTALNNKQYWR